MNYDDIISEFINAFPELEYEARDEIDSWDSEFSFPHLLFIQVVNPYLERELLNNKNKIMLNRLFDFIERMANSDDEKVRDVVIATVLWRLSDPSLIESARAYMGENTRFLNDSIEQWYDNYKANKQQSQNKEIL